MLRCNVDTEDVEKLDSYISLKDGGIGRVPEISPIVKIHLVSDPLSFKMHGGMTV